MAELEQDFADRIEAHRKIVYKVCRLYCADPADREDLAQEILMQLWRSYPGFDGRCLFSTWMYRVALNTAISFAREAGPRQRRAAPSELLEAMPAPAEESEQVRTMYQLIASLDPLHRALILLYLDGNSYEEIAAILGISATNVATRLNRLKLSLKNQCQPRSST